MPKGFKLREARALMERYRILFQQREYAAKAETRCAQAVRDAAEAMAADKVHSLLEGIPIEEVNREKKGIRIKALREAGYSSMADLAAASQDELEALNGISEAGAAQIQATAAQMKKYARQSVRLQISLDNRNPKAARLVRAVSCYLGVKPLMPQLEAANREENGAIEQAVQTLSVGRNFLCWLFAGGKKRREAEEAYWLLLEREECAEAEQRQIVSGIEQAEARTEEEAWADFAEHAIAFFGALEALVPDLFGSEALHFGLPDDLAQAVQAEELHLDGLRCTLRGYQTWGVKYALHQKRVLLGDEMGLGKTVQAIAEMVSLFNKGETHFLVVCPASVLTNWRREIQKHSALRVSVLHGPERRQALKDWSRNGGAAVTTYETTAKFELEADFRLGLLVADEAHYIKNPEAQRTQNVQRLSEHADRILFLTGTALENRVEEMVSLIAMLQPETAQRVKGMEALSSAPLFRQLVAPVYFRRRRAEVLRELPELIENSEWCRLGTKERLQYERAVLAGRYAEARRVSWTTERFADSAKAQRMLDIVEEAEEDGRKIIVFSFYLETIDQVLRWFGGRCVPPITGAASPLERQKIVDAFDEAPAGTILPAQIQAGGTGLNIQSASVVILCEPQFKPSAENQAISRAYRMGQTRSVLVFRLLADDTLDEQITELLENKQVIFDEFADESDAARDSLALDAVTFGAMIQKEIDRITRRQRERA